LHIEFKALQFDAGLIGTIFDNNFTEIRLSRFWAEAGKFRASDCYTIVPLRAGIIEYFYFYQSAHYLAPLTNPIIDNIIKRAAYDKQYSMPERKKASQRNVFKKIAYCLLFDSIRPNQ
jgi:hypothetical protein